MAYRSICEKKVLREIVVWPRAISSSEIILKKCVGDGGRWWWGNMRSNNEKILCDEKKALVLISHVGLAGWDGWSGKKKHFYKSRFGISSSSSSFSFPDIGDWGGSMYTVQWYKKNQEKTPQKVWGRKGGSFTFRRGLILYVQVYLFLSGRYTRFKCVRSKELSGCFGEAMALFVLRLKKPVWETAPACAF